MSRDVSTLTKATAEAANRALSAWVAAGLDVFITCTRRTFEEQAALWAIGRSQPGRIVTYSTAGTSKHEFGLAFDVAFKGKDLYPSDAKLWARLGAIGEECGLDWGGNFKKFKDKPHFQLKETT